MLEIVFDAEKAHPKGCASSLCSGKSESCWSGERLFLHRDFRVRMLLQMPKALIAHLMLLANVDELAQVL